MNLRTWAQIVVSSAALVLAFSVSNAVAGNAGTVTMHMCNDTNCAEGSCRMFLIEPLEQCIPDGEAGVMFSCADTITVELYNDTACTKFEASVTTRINACLRGRTNEYEYFTCEPNGASTTTTAKSARKTERSEGLMLEQLRRRLHQ